MSAEGRDVSAEGRDVSAEGKDVWEWVCDEIYHPVGRTGQA